jgi:hypothetical protein
LTGAKFLTLPELGELAARLDALHRRTTDTIARLDGEIDAQKARVARHWEGVRALGLADRGRVMAEQASAAIRAIRQDARSELDGIIKEAGASYGPLAAQRPYCTSRATVLNRQGLGTSRRNLLEETAERARQVGLAGLAQLAIGTADLVLAARRRQRERPAPRVGAGVLDRRAHVADAGPRRVRQGPAVPENRMNAIALAIRTWQTARPAPVARVAMAYATMGEDGAVVEELVQTGGARQRQG